MTKKTGPTRVDSNPYHQLVEIMNQQGIMQFKVNVKRQDPPTKQWRSLTWWPGLGVDDIANIEEIIGQQYGGGNYVVGIANNADQKEKLINYAFSIEGPPKYPQGDPAMFNPNNPYGPPQQGGWYGQPQQGYPQAFQGPQINPAVMPSPYGYPYPPPHYPPPYIQHPPPPQKPDGPSPEETALREQLKASQKQHDDLMRKLDEEKHQRELDRRESETSRKLDALQASHKEEMAQIKAALEKTSDNSGNKLIETMLQLSKTNQEAIVEMKKSEAENMKANLEMQMKQVEKDYDQRKEMMAWVQAAQDPSKHADLLEKFGQYAANNLQLITQVAQSGLLAPQDNEPGWMQPLRELIEGGKEFGNKFFEQQERRAQQRMQHSREAYRFAPQRQLPPQGYGAQTQIPPQQPPQPSPQPPTDGSIIVGEVPDSMKAQLQEIGKAIYLKKPAYQVAEMMYNVVDYGRYWAHIPSLAMPGWMEPIFERPKDTITAILQKYAPQVPLDETYLNEVQNYFFEIHGQFLAEQEAAKNAEQEQQQQQEQPQKLPQEPPGEGPEAAPPPELPSEEDQPQPPAEG